MTLPGKSKQTKTGLVIGAPVTVGDRALARAAILAAARQGQGGYVCVANVHMVTTARRDPRLLEAMRRALWVTSDGMPLVWALRRGGHKEACRVAGPDLLCDLLAAAEKESLPVYFYGGDGETAARLKDVLVERYPRLIVAGVDAPPALALEPVVEPVFVERLNASGAALLFVGLGCPKQEYWMAAHAPHLKAVSLGVGAAFNFLAGTVRRAPGWMQNLGLEWLFRLLAEPRRLWRRYLVTNSLFIWYYLGAFLGSKDRRM